MNWVKVNRERLSTNNYIRKADAKTNYWLDLSEGKLQYYRNLTQDNFNIIIYGDDDDETDFYTIPYSELKHLLVEENFSLSKQNSRKRWVGNIIFHKIQLGLKNTRLNISQFYSNILLANNLQLISQSIEENDYAIENAKREVLTRTKQSIFRRKVLENFSYQCCLTGITENGLLVASHIIPWATKIDTRLSPHNGLCLSILYDILFDKGFFTFSEQYEVIITSKVEELSKETQNCLNVISKKVISFPAKYEISQSALEFHRNNIFDRFK